MLLKRSYSKIRPFMCILLTWFFTFKEIFSELRSFSYYNYNYPKSWLLILLKTNELVMWLFSAMFNEALKQLETMLPANTNIKVSPALSCCLLLLLVFLYYFVQTPVETIESVEILPYWEFYLHAKSFLLVLWHGGYHFFTIYVIFKYMLS